MEKFLIKDNEEIYLNFIKLTNNNYAIEAYNCVGEEVGILEFIYPYKNLFNRSWLSLIKVNNPNYLNRGVGNVMIKCFECFLKAKSCCFVSGRFCPDGEGAKYSKAFYKRHKYSIQTDEYGSFLFKNLDKNIISNQL